MAQLMSVLDFVILLRSCLKKPQKIRFFSHLIDGAFLADSIICDKKNSAACITLLPVKKTDTRTEPDRPHYKSCDGSVMA